MLLVRVPPPISRLELNPDRLFRAHVPTVLFACKSDLSTNVAIDPAHANSIAEPFNVGLIEVSDLSHDGRSKMRNGMRWLVYKLEQRLSESTQSIKH